MRATVRDEVESLNVRGVEEELRQGAVLTLQQVQGLDVSAQVSVVIQKR